MRTLVSERQRKFYRLTQEAFRQPTDWLIRVLRDQRLRGNPSYLLSRAARLRALTFRERTGLPFGHARRAMRRRLEV